jgi:secretion/DNA translocation related TadE-like protein
MSGPSPGDGVRRVQGERGSGTLLGVAVVLVLAVVAGGVLVVAGYIAAVHHARSAADMVALSGAAQQARGDGACRAAARIATANSVRLVGCQVRGDSFDFVVSVTVEQMVRAPALLPQSVAAGAHAGRLGLLQ